jgi:hypothetical protein
MIYEKSYKENAVCRKGIKNDVREDKLYLSDKGTFEQRFE